jgi:predicted dehydrogenase
MSLDAEAAGFLEVAPHELEDAGDAARRQQLGEMATDGVIFFGVGDNFRNMEPAARHLSEQHPVYLVEYDQEPPFPVPREQKFLVANQAEDAALHDLLDSGRVNIGYVGLPPKMHERVTAEHLARIGAGKMRYLVVTKPVVPDVKSLKRLDAAVAAAYEQRRETRPEATDPIIYVHEHYIEKGAWHALRQQLPEVVDRLGRLRKFTANIEEEQAIEDEPRGLDAFGDGALGDFGPHTISLALNAKDAINKSNRYTITDYSSTETRPFRYADSQLPADVPTGFIVKGNASIVDKDTAAQHDVEFVWRAGKGLGEGDKKYVALEFENPDSGVVSTIHVDLKHNSLQFSDEVPDDVRALFAHYDTAENGYGPIVEQGLNGGHPRNSFQPWEQARIVTKWMSVLEKQAERLPSYVYDRRHNFTLEDLEESAFSPAA